MYLCAYVFFIRKLGKLFLEIRFLSDVYYKYNLFFISVVNFYIFLKIEIEDSYTWA